MARDWTACVAIASDGKAPHPPATAFNLLGALLPQSSVELSLELLFPTFRALSRLPRLD
jgi:hypothetical protein